MEKLLAKAKMFDLESETKEAEALSGCGVFVGKIRKAPDKTKAILIISEPGDPLVTLEFKLEDIVQHELINQESGLAEIYVRPEASYVACAHLSVEWEAPVDEPLIERVFRGAAPDVFRGGGCEAQSCSCNVGCKCDKTHDSGAQQYYTNNALRGATRKVMNIAQRKAEGLGIA
jgi:hypothetical protein